MDVVRRAIPTETSAPDGTTNAYVLGRDPALLIDPAGCPEDLDELVERHGVEHIAVTHAHPDHVGAVARYAAHIDRPVTCWAATGHEDRFEDATGVAPDATFTDGDRLSLGGGTVRIVALPGHAPDHVGFAVTDDGPAFCGDCVVRDGSVVVGGDGANMRDYLHSLDRLAALDPPTMLPGHGPPIEDPLAAVDRLRSHRERRERRVKDAVDRGAETPDEILAVAYEKDLADVRALARDTVIAHLEKLDADGELSWDGARATPT
ncbi:MBL fold metallo-hydrolase [Halovivax cerinus]|uniref:MBL fold metallo-hydrolase n=1 Tax=Halovivax cerinus TaxID=1487865 RepID=A0ABD5NL08_9EURY|nr:MBL fold metallo-hydrolase [Halovivax cerinus]